MRNGERVRRNAANDISPAIVLQFETGQQWRTMRGRNCLLVFASDWAEGGCGEAMRAELRGVGAELAVLLPQGGFYLHPDEVTQRLRPAPHLWAAFGVRALAEGGPALTIVLIDGEGRIRFRRETEAPHPIEQELLEGLRAAGRRVRGATRSRGISRRELLASSIASALALALFDGCASSTPKKTGTAAPPATAAPSADESALINVALNVNGERRTLRIEPRVTLLDALRENLALTGTKKGCDMGQCGACTILVEGERINSCLALAAQYEGRNITTIEGLARGDELHPMQTAFIQHDAFQCGYCTPGQILSAVALLREGHARTDAEIRENMSGNICRCGAYPNIVAAIRATRS